MERLFYGQIEEGLLPVLLLTPQVKRPVEADYNRVGVGGRGRGLGGEERLGVASKR